MWTNLDRTEIQLILQSIPEGPLAQKLRDPPDPDTQAFISAVSTDDELEVDPDAVISRGDEGAFVMSWTWVSNAAAGLDDEPQEDSELEGGFLDEPVQGPCM